MKTRTIGYWASTGLVAFAFAAGGIFDISGAPAVTGAMTHLGYPGYFATILGAWKVLGAVAVLAPRFPRVKEWAYAGMFFDVSGAAMSHAAVGDPVGNVMTPIVIALLLVASWLLRPASRTLGETGPSAGAARVAAGSTVVEAA